MAQHEIWQPDILCVNSISPNVEFSTATHFIAYQNGKVSWVPPATFKTLCESSPRNWPFDSHTCTLLFGSSVYTAHEVEVVPREPETAFEMFIENPEWKVLELKADHVLNVYPFCTEPYGQVRFNITIVRRSTIYHTVIFAPAFVVIILTLLTFCLPAHYAGKILLNGTTVLIIALLLLYFSRKLNIIASHTPLIGMHSLFVLNFVFSSFP